jgi:hypothetical protein
MKVTNQLFLNKVRNKSFAKRVGPVFETCTKHLDSSFLIPMEVRLRTIGTRIKKPKIERATGRRKTMVNQQQKKEQEKEDNKEEEEVEGEGVRNEEQGGGGNRKEAPSLAERSNPRQSSG